MRYLVRARIAIGHWPRFGTAPNLRRHSPQTTLIFNLSDYFVLKIHLGCLALTFRCILHPSLDLTAARAAANFGGDPRQNALLYGSSLISKLSFRLVQPLELLEC